MKLYECVKPILEWTLTFFVVWALIFSIMASVITFVLWTTEIDWLSLKVVAFMTSILFLLVRKL